MEHFAYFLSNINTYTSNQNQMSDYNFIESLLNQYFVTDASRCSSCHRFLKPEDSSQCVCLDDKQLHGDVLSLVTQARNDKNGSYTLPVPLVLKANTQYRAAERDEVNLKEGDIFIVRKVFGDGWASGSRVRHKEPLKSGLAPLVLLS